MNSDTRVAADLVIRHPKTLPAHATVGEVRAQLADDHVHLALLTDGHLLVGTLLRSDLPASVRDEDAARRHALLGDRVVLPDRSASEVYEDLRRRGVRRVAVMASDGVLVGLACLNRRLTGFCSDGDVSARAEDRLSRNAEHEG